MLTEAHSLSSSRLASTASATHLGNDFNVTGQPGLEGTSGHVRRADECSGRVTRVCVRSLLLPCPAAELFSSGTCLVQCPCLWLGVRAVCVMVPLCLRGGAAHLPGLCHHHTEPLITWAPNGPVAAVAGGLLLKVLAPPYSQNNHKGSTTNPVLRVNSVSFFNAVSCVVCPRHPL